ncbi:MAG: hypothetical protein QM523_02490 [Candidatus Pacebacteria bacterium]|nr:hypothetical protein [Candidatus Paceibacterota bacterium]
MTQPLYIGITGHRDPRTQAVAGLRLAVENFYRRLAQDGGFNLTLVSGLAEGADRLAAQVFIETRRKMAATNGGFTVYCPLSNRNISLTDSG